MAGIAAVGLAIASQSLAIETGSLKAHVRDAAGGALPGATVIVSQLPGPEIARQATNATGEALFERIPVGSYEVRCELSGLQPDFVALVRVKPQWSNPVTLTMTVVYEGCGIRGDVLLVPTDTVGIMATGEPVAPLNHLVFGRTLVSMYTGTTP